MVFCLSVSFKPCYKWNTFNTNGQLYDAFNKYCFKPCYKWNTFNTVKKKMLKLLYHRFKPCYKWNTFNTMTMDDEQVKFMAF